MLQIIFCEKVGISWTANKIVTTDLGVILTGSLDNFVTHFWSYRYRRKLRTDVAAAFPNLSAEQLTEFIPNKEELNVIKIYSHKGEAVTVYMNNRNPILFEIEKALYPTGTGSGWNHPLYLLGTSLSPKDFLVSFLCTYPVAMVSVHLFYQHLHEISGISGFFLQKRKFRCGEVRNQETNLLSHSLAA